MSEPGKAIFLSYASQDAEAARKICDALRRAGIEVWFDQSELVGGDQWDQKIRKQIKECALLIPVISANTQARTEGYFRLEWRLADQRTHLMAKGRSFLLPVVIDHTCDAEAHVPDSFTEVQWTRLPGGETPPKFAEQVKRLLDGSAMEAGRPRPATEAHNQEPRTENRRLGRLWWALPIFGVTMALVLVLKEGRQDPAPPPSGPVPVIAAPLTEAQKLVAQARKIWEEGDEINRETYFLAEDLIKRAVGLDPADGSAWALYAQISGSMIWFSIDDSAARRDAFRRQVERARVLAPESIQTRLAEANLRLQLSQDIPVAEREALRLVADAPDNWRVQRALGFTYRLLRRPADAQRVLERACELSRNSPQASADLVNMLLKRNRYAEAEKVAAAARARSSSGRLLTYEVMFLTRWRGDLAAAGAAARAWPDWLLLEDRGAFFAWEVALWNRQPEQALVIAQRVQRDYLNDSNFRGPRAVLTARAHEMAGHVQAAQTDWRTAVQAADRVLAESPEDSSALHWKAWALARLGDQAGAQAIVTRMQQSNLPGTSQLYQLTTIAPLYATVGLADQAIEDIRARFGDEVRGYALPRAVLERDPSFDGLRADPRFQELLKSAPAPEEKGPSGSAATLATDQKSVAVLAFANLSDDKANEYFSDGISEELLNVLARIPGLKVSARTSAFYFKGKDTPVPEIARQLGVAYVVEGSVRKQDGKVRIAAKLIKAADGFPVWSDTFTRDLKDIFAVQDEIAGLVAGKLSLKLGVTTSAAERPVDPEAYRLMLLGRAFVHRATQADVKQAQQYLREALERDPKLAPAWAWLSIACWAEAGNGWAPAAPGFAAARTAAERAVALDPDLPEAHNAIGLVYYGYDWDWRRARDSFERAAALAPSDAGVVSNLARLATTTGAGDLAVRLGRRAVELDPLNSYAQYVLCMALFQAGRFEELGAQVPQLLALSRNGVKQQVFSLLMLKRNEEALRAAGSVDGANGRFLVSLASWACGRKTEAEATLAQLKATAADTAAYQIAQLYGHRGEVDEAFVWLEASFRQRDTGMIWLKNDPLLRGLHSDARWPGLLRKMGLADDQLK